MYIKGDFKNINEKTYSVHITDCDMKKDVLVIGENDLFFSSDPLTIETNNDNTFEHIIHTSATINLKTTKYLGDLLFADNSRSISVNIFKEKELIFSGYVEPATFTQPYASVYDEFTINCVDSLSTLQYFNYKNISNVDKYNSFKQQAGTISFIDMLKNSIFDGITKLDKIKNTTTHIYYDLSKGINETRLNTIFNDLSISESYILGEEFDDIWTNEDLLNEILQYLNLHIIQKGADYYIFDWDSIRKKNTQWYDLLSNTTVTFPATQITIDKDKFASDDSNISISDVFNCIQLTDELKTKDTVIESPLDTSSLYSKYSGKVKYMTEYISEGSGDNAHNSMWNMLNGKPTDYDAAKEIDWYMQPMSNTNWNFYYQDGKTIEELYENENGQYINPYKTALYLKENPLTPALFSFGSIEKKAKALDNSPTSKIGMENYLYISVNGNELDEQATPTETDIKNKKGMIEYIGGSSAGVYSPVDDKTTNYLVFSGKILLQPIVYETNVRVASRDNGYKAILDNGGFTKWEGHKAIVPLYDLNTYAKLYALNQLNNLVKSDNNKEGRYYVRKFYNDTYVNNHSDNNYLTKASLQPWTKDKAAQGYQFNYSNVGDGNDKISKVPVLECELIIGNKYCVETVMDTTTTAMDETKFEWLTIDEIQSREDLKYTDKDGSIKYKTTFSLGFNPKIGDYIIGQEYDIQNNISYTQNLDVEGTAIPIKKTDNLNGAIIFRILGPVNSMWNNILKREANFWRHTKWSEGWHSILSHTENIIIKDFNCKVCSDGAGLTSYGDKDLIYTSAESQQYINKKDDITFKFITQLSSEESIQKGINPSINLNAVIDNTSSLPITQIYNANTKETDKAEKHYISQYYKEYSRPRIIFETSLNDEDYIDFRNTYYYGMLKKYMYIQSMSYDIFNDSVQLKLKEQ